MKGFGFKAHMVPLLAVLLCLMAAGPLASVSAQPATSQTLVGGQTVSWSTPWSHDPELSSSGDGFDLLALQTDLGLIGVGSYGYQISGSEVRDVAIDSFAGEVPLLPVDRGDYDNVSYSLDIADDGSFAFGLFTLVVESNDGTLLSLLLAPVDTFQTQMESAQAGVIIDGEPIFDGVDAAGMQGFLDAASVPDGGTLPPLPTEPVAPPAAPTEAPAPTVAAGSGTGGSDGLVGGINANLGDEDTAPGNPTPASGNSTAAAPALLNGYTIPASGVTVSWSNEWTVSEQEATTIQLEASSQLAFLRVFDAGPGPASVTAPELAQSLLEQQVSGTEVVFAVDSPTDPARKIIVLSEPDPELEIYRIYDLRLQPEHSTVVLLSVIREDVVPVYELVQMTVQVAGEPALSGIEALVPGLFNDFGI